MVWLLSGEIAEKGSTTHKPFIKSIEARMPFVKEGEVNFRYADARYRNLKTYNAFFSTQILYNDRVALTLVSSRASVYWHEKRNINDTECCRISTFPADFDFCGQSVCYVCGMSVPPLMIKCIATEIKRQGFEFLKSSNKILVCIL